MNTYLINTTLGLFVVMAEEAKQAYFKHITEDSYLGDSFITREELLNRGYVKLEKTNIQNVYQLTK